MKKVSWDSEQELFDLVRAELFTALTGDIMDAMGLMRQFLPPSIKPLRQDMVVVGRAMPVLEADVFCDVSPSGRNPSLVKPFGYMLEALDDLKPNEVYVCSGGSPSYALWGELMSTRALKLGAVGAVLNGYSRDTRGILSLDFPTFSLGTFAQDQAPRGKVVDWRVPLEIDGVRIEPGDIIFGDLDGVCVIPQEVHVEVFSRSLERGRSEQKVRQAIQEGMAAREAFDTYEIM